MSTKQRSMIEELRCNAQSLAQLASWQLALARDMEGKLTDLASLSDDRGTHPEASSSGGKGKVRRRRA